MNHLKQAITDLKAGKPVILVDDEGRENEADLIYPATMTDTTAIAFLLKHCSGIVCLVLTPERLDQLEIPLMVKPDENTSQLGTNFTVTIEAKTGVTTGVSAQDRAHTIQVAIDPKTQANDIAKPGHIFPLRAHPLGLKGRQGHTEGALALVEIAGFYPAAVLCELMNPDGSMAKHQDIERFAIDHQLCVVRIDELTGAYQALSQHGLKKDPVPAL